MISTNIHSSVHINTHAHKIIPTTTMHYQIKVNPELAGPDVFSISTIYPVDVVFKSLGRDEKAVENIIIPQNRLKR